MLVQYAVFWYLTVEFQSGVIMTLAAVFGFLPQAVVSVFGGCLGGSDQPQVADHGRGRGIALSTLGLALILLAGYAEPWVIFATLAIRSAGAGFQMPAVSALDPADHAGEPADAGQRLPGLDPVRARPRGAGGRRRRSTPGRRRARRGRRSLVPVFAIDIVTAVIGHRTAGDDPRQARCARRRTPGPATSPISSTGCGTSPPTHSCAGC